MEIRQHLLKSVSGLAEYGIAVNTIRYMFVSPNMRRKSSDRYIIYCSNLVCIIKYNKAKLHFLKSLLRAYLRCF